MAPHPGSRITAATVVALRLDCAVGIGSGNMARRKRRERKEEERIEESYNKSKYQERECNDWSGLLSAEVGTKLDRFQCPTSCIHFSIVIVPKPSKNFQKNNHTHDNQL